MKAVVLNEVGDVSGLKLTEIDIPNIEENEVLIELKAAAVNRRDLLITLGQYPGLKVPIIPGADGVGVVVAVGSKATNHKIGDQVIINPGFEWGENTNLKSKNFNILGFPKNGTFEEFINVPEENVYSKPKHLNWEEAAALPLAGLTAYRALVTKGKVLKNETVLIPGAGGGVATFLIQFAKALDANVYVTSSSAQKIVKAKEIGAIDGVNYRDLDWPEQLLKLTNGIDLTVDSIAGDVFQEFIKVGKIGSRIVSFGSTRGPVPNLVLPTMTLKEMTLIGSTMGSSEDFIKMLELVETHTIKPVIDKIFKLEDISKALEYVQKGENFGKVVLNFS